MAINAYARAVTDRVVVPVGRGLVRLGATANWLTFFGLLFTLVGVGLIVSGHQLLGAIVAGVAAIVDALDGTVARLRGTCSRFGAFYDSVTDRIADAAVFAAAAWLVRDDPLHFALAMVALGGAQVTSYMRAKAESLGWNATVGIVERPERMIVILLAIGFGYVEIALWLLAVGAAVTIAQRLRAVLRQAGGT